MGILPVQSQHLEQTRREHYVAIFTAFALSHADHHPLAVDIGDLQVYDFGDTQAGRVGRHQDGALFQAGNRLEETRDFLKAQDDGQLHGPSGQGKVLVAPVASERDSIQEAQRAYGELDTGWRELAFVGEVDNPGTDLFRTKLLR
ncbi:hypothetical protein QF001_000375 [Paraburkholderia youngii]